MKAAGARPILVTGGAGFIGCNLASRLAREGNDVIVLDSLARAGVRENLDWLKSRHGNRVTFLKGDVTERSCVLQAVTECRAIFHLAAQVAVTTSLEHPQIDLDVNVRGTLNILEAARACRSSPAIVFASTNKVYGNLQDLALEKRGARYVPSDPAIASSGIAESRPLSFHTPYGCSKGAADQYVLDYAASFGMKTAVLRMSCIYGPHQFGTEDQGWVAHFARRALDGEPISIFGDGCQVRDILYVDDAVEAYVRALQRIGTIRGRAFNLGGGPANAVSLRELLAHFSSVLGRHIGTQFHDWRSGDQRYYVSDTRAISSALALPRARGWEKGCERLLAHMRRRHPPRSRFPRESDQLREVLA